MTIQPSRVAQSLRRAATILDDHGQAMLQRASDWTQPPRQGEGHRWTRGGGLAAEGDQADDDRNEDHQQEAQAARYHAELTTLIGRMDADAARVEALRSILLPAAPHRIGTADMQAIQLAADGWCTSCARDRDNHDRPFLEPVKKGRFSDACSFCGEWRQDNKGQDPPLEFVRYRHQSGNKRLTSKVVDAILRRTA